MFQFTGFPLHAYGFSIQCMRSSHAGFPIQTSAALTDICSSPQLFAAYHVFLRLLVPRHPPCALSSLTSFPRKSFPSYASASHMSSVTCAWPFVTLVTSFGFPTFVFCLVLDVSYFSFANFDTFLFGIRFSRFFFQFRLWLKRILHPI